MIHSAAGNIPVASASPRRLVSRVTLGRWTLGATAVFLAVLGAITLAIKLWRLVEDPGPQGGIDIKILYRFTRAWFDGLPIYSAHRTAGVTYPPATWLLLWPAYGWVSLEVARAMWAIVDLAALAMLGLVFSRAIGDGPPLARICAALAPVSMPALADALGIGQLTIVVLPLAIGAVLLAIREKPTWKSDLLAAGLFVTALVKPSLTVPFFVLLLIVPRRIRPAALATIGYALVTIASSLFQPTDLQAQIRGWLTQAQGNAGAGYGNIQDWLFQVGWSRAFPPASLALLGVLGAFVWWRRHVDVWLLLGISAVVARLWTYHRVYDDGVLIIGVIALARFAAQYRNTHVTTWLSRTTLMVSALVLWMPLQFHYVHSTIGPFVIQPSAVLLFNITHSAVALVTLTILAVAAIGASDDSRRIGDALPRASEQC